MKNLSDDMIHGNITKNLILFSIPLFLSYFLQAFYSSVDAIVVGRYAALGDVTGVTQGGQIVNILTQGITGFSISGTVLVTRYIGAKREEDLRQSISTLFSLFAIASLAVTIIMFLCNGLIINLLNMPSEARVPTLRYLQVCETGIIFIFFYNCISAVLQATGDSKHPLLFVCIACGVHIMLDLLLVGYFKMGALGAGIATVIAQMLSVLLSIRFLRRQNFPFKFSIREFRIYREKLRLLLKLGIPYASMRMAVAVSYLAVSGLANVCGLAASSASGVVAKINNFVTMPYSALQAAVATMAGQNIGAGSLKRAHKSFLVGAGLSFGTGLFIYALVQAIPGQILGIFVSNAEMIAIGKDFFKLFSISYLMMAINYPIHGLMTACGYTWIPTLDGVIASLVLRIPVAGLFSKLMGFPGIAFGSSLSVLGSLIPAVFLYCSGIWKKTVERSDI